ncbi:oligoribonuclease, partial [Gammaproteobacteria bacterium]|nr:oligoribonuclease [Gammaproteobacteria bacterium]
MKSLQSKDNLIWIDLEMTGLDPEKEKIIEIATLITDSQLNILAEGPNLIISQPKSLLDEMDEWNQNQHGSSGLIDAVKKSAVTQQMAEIETLEFISKYVGQKKSPMCGNTVSHDRRFLIKYMPRLESYFNYRHI